MTLSPRAITPPTEGLAIYPATALPLTFHLLSEYLAIFSNYTFLPQLCTRAKFNITSCLLKLDHDSTRKSYFGHG